MNGYSSYYKGPWTCKVIKSALSEFICPWTIAKTATSIHISFVDDPMYLCSHISSYYEQSYSLPLRQTTTLLKDYKLSKVSCHC